MSQRHCPATLPNGTPCGRSTYGRTWCDKHKGLAKHYRTYKAANAAVADTVAIPIQQLDDTQLDHEQTQLFTSVTQRQHLKDVGYGTASDSGHDYRIEWEGKRLGDVLTEAQRRQAQPVPASVDDTPEVRRPAQPTSSRQVKQRKCKPVVNNGLAIMQQRDVVFSAMSHLSVDVNTMMDNMAITQFTERYGERGPALYHIAMKCAWQLCVATMYSHKTTRHGDDDERVLTNADVFTTPPMGYTVGDVIVEGIIERHGVKHASIMKMWACMVVLNTFAMNFCQDASTQSWWPKYIASVSVINDSDVDILMATITRLSQDIIGNGKAFREKWRQNIQQYTTAAATQPLPTISEKFCHKVLAEGVTQWYLIYVGKRRYAYAYDHAVRNIITLPDSHLSPTRTVITLRVDHDAFIEVVNAWVHPQRVNIPSLVIWMLSDGIAWIPTASATHNTQSCDAF